MLQNTTKRQRYPLLSVRVASNRFLVLLDVVARCQLQTWLRGPVVKQGLGIRCMGSSDQCVYSCNKRISTLQWQNIMMEQHRPVVSIPS